MARASTTRTSNATKPEARSAVSEHPVPPDGGRYVLPLIHTGVPSRVVDLGFWGALAGSMVLGAVDPPLGLLVGAGVVVARHHARSGAA